MSDGEEKKPMGVDPEVISEEADARRRRVEAHTTWIPFGPTSNDIFDAILAMKDEIAIGKPLFLRIDFPGLGMRVIASPDPSDIPVGDPSW
jgi:hypothetical protein